MTAAAPLDLVATARRFLAELPDPDRWREALPAWADEEGLTADQVHVLKVAILRVRAFNATAIGAVRAKAQPQGHRRR